MKNSALRKFLFLFLAGITLASIYVTSAAAYDVELYNDTWNTKREWLDNGNINEYSNEDLTGFWRGRAIFAYEPTGYNGNPGYKTWNWNLSPSQVTMQEYEGSYSVAFGSPTWEQDPTWATTNQPKRRTSVVYDHSGNILNLDTGTNGWIMREKTIYESVSDPVKGYVAGTTVSEKYFYNASGLLTKEIHPVPKLAHDGRTYYTYEYYNYPGMTESIRFKNVYSYTAAQEAGVLAGTMPDSEATFIAQYEYVRSNDGQVGYMVKREPNGKITTFFVRPSSEGGQSYNNTYIETDSTSPNYNVLFIFNYDADWNVTTIEKYYPNGVVEICTPNYVVTQRRVPEGTFIKGVNLPWNNYGYDIGSTATGEHYGFSRNVETLYQKMDPYKGMMVRLFLFTDLRAGMTFNASGVPTGFTANVYEDMDALLACAKSLGIKVMPVLFDYLLGVRYEGGVWVRGAHADLIDDPVKRAALLNIISGFIDHYKGNESIFAWDIMNEPEWAHEFGNWVSMPALYDFVREFAVMIKSKGEIATTGNHDRTDLLAMVNHWITGGYSNPILSLYQFHYYTSGELTDPLDYPASDLNLGSIPIIVGEVGSTDITNRLDILRRQGYLGGLFWQDGQPDMGENRITATQLDEIISWFYGTSYAYTYYLTSPYRIESATLSRADAGGNIYYHYIDEAGSRVDKYRKSVIDSDGCLSYDYAYSGSTTRVITKRGYSDSNWTTLNVTYSYYDNATNRLESKTTILSDIYGNTYYHYIDENFNSQGYGRVDKQVMAAADSDGALSCVYQYFPGTSIISEKTLYSDSAFTNLLLTYTYYADGLLKEKVLASVDIYGNLYYHYIDENFNSQGYGRVDKQVMAAADSDGALSCAYQYFPGTSIISEKTLYSDSAFTNLLLTYTYYADGLLKEKVLASVDIYGNLYYHYIDENFNSQGYGRVDKQVAAAADSDGCLSYTYTYYASGKMESKIGYSANNWTGVVATFNYYDTATNRLSTKKVVSETAAGEFNGKNVMYYYNDEQHRQAVDGSWYGRVNRIDNITESYADELTFHSNVSVYPPIINTKTRRVLNGDGTLGTTLETYVYYNDTNNRVKSKIVVEGGVTVTYTYFNDSNNRLASKAFSSPVDGTIRYDYFNEDFDHNGNGTIGSNENYGRIYQTYTSDGRIFTNEVYYAGTNLKARMQEGGSSAYPGTLQYFYSNYSATTHDPANEIGFRKIDAGATTAHTDYIKISRLAKYTSRTLYANGLQRVTGTTTDLDGVSNPAAFDGYQMGNNFYELVSGDVYLKKALPGSPASAKLHVTINTTAGTVTEGAIVETYTIINNGEYALYHKEDANGDRYWYKWNGWVSPSAPSLFGWPAGWFIVFKYEASTGRKYAYAFDPNSSDPTNPFVQQDAQGKWINGQNASFNENGIVGFELPAWPPAAVDYPSAPIIPFAAPQPLIQQSAAIEPPVTTEITPKLTSDEQARIDFQATLTTTSSTKDGVTFVPAMADSNKLKENDLLNSSTLAIPAASQDRGAG